MKIGIDIGATKIRVGEVFDGKVGRVFEEKTERKDIPSQVIRLINKFNYSKIDGIGIGIAGQIEPREGTIIFSPNIRIRNLKLGSILKERLETPISIDNDCRCQTLGEYKYGAGKGKNTLIGVFIGTGIGGGIIIDGKLVHGHSFMASEIGHMVIDIDGPLCGCGRKGCFEALAGGIYLKKTRKTNDELGRIIGIGVTNLANIINPECVVLGGGVIDGIPELVDIVKTVVYNETFSPPDIQKAILGKNSGIIGAVCLLE
ncbi:TPA: hypothetical protein DCX16_00280 [bacterium]|nr:hypothetical protein [bacterium]